MTPLELCEKLGGYSNINKLIAAVNGKPTYIAAMNAKGEYEFTAVGKTLAAEMNAKAAVGLADQEDAAEEKPKRKPRKAKAEETAESTDEEVAQEAEPE